LPKKRGGGAQRLREGGRKGTGSGVKMAGTASISTTSSEGREKGPRGGGRRAKRGGNHKVARQRDQRKTDPLGGGSQKKKGWVQGGKGVYGEKEGKKGTTNTQVGGRNPHHVWGCRGRGRYHWRGGEGGNQ